MWVYDLSPEAFGAEFATRVMSHPAIQRLTKGDARLNGILSDAIEEVARKQMEYANRKCAGDAER